MPDMLNIEGLHAGYADSIVLNDISLSLDQGETLALLGRNGTGKTTLINTVVGVTRRHKGSIQLGGQPLEHLAPHVRARAGIGWVPQERNIFRSLTVHENLTAVARPGSWTPAKVYDTFPRLAERKGNMGAQLSGGEQQMLAIGRALVLNPRLLLLDEPTEGLAPILVEEVLRGIENVTKNEGLSVIIVEQHPQLILAISQRAVILDRGTVVHQGPAHELRHDQALLNRWLGVSV